ncbi:hypothetical protein TgHK011_004016 [Trichoderma gracile]|nr:hypothetical protein TgHK011_004016 [Trichoderma gracile]
MVQLPDSDASAPVTARQRGSAQEGGQGSGSVTGGGRLRLGIGRFESDQELSRVEVEAANMTFRGEERGSRAG